MGTNQRETTNSEINIKQLTADIFAKLEQVDATFVNLCELVSNIK